MIDFRRSKWRQRHLLSLSDEDYRVNVGVTRLLPRAYDGMDSGAMGYHLAPVDLSRQRRSLSGEQAASGSDFRRTSFAGESDSASTIARGRGDDVVNTTPVGSYINGVLGGSHHPGLAGNDEGEDEEAAEEEDDEEATDAVDEDAKSARESAAEQVVRLRAENAELRERLLQAEQELAEAQQQKATLQDRLGAVSQELEDASEELQEERQQLARLRSRRLEMPQARSPSPPPPPDAVPAVSPPAGSSLESDLELTNRRMQSLERSVIELQRRIASEQAASEEEEEEEDRRRRRQQEAEEANAEFVTQLTNQTLSIMTKEITELRTGAETLRARMRQLDERRQQQLRDLRQRQQADERVSDDAILSVSVSLEATRHQNQQLQRQLDANEKEKTTQSKQLKRLQTSAKLSQRAWDEWTARAESSREDLHQLSNANVQLRDRLRQLDSSLLGQQAQLDSVRADAASKAERCKQLANDCLRLQRQLRESNEEAKRLRQSEQQLRQLNDGLVKLLALADSENKETQRTLLRLAECAHTLPTAELISQIREAARALRTDLEVPSAEDCGSVLSHEVDKLLGRLRDSDRRCERQHHELQRLRGQWRLAVKKLTQCEARMHQAREARGDSSGDKRESQVQLAALIQQIDLVESRGLTDPTLAFRSEHENVKRQQASQEEIELAETDESQRVEVQRLVRMLLYNSRTG